ncbi:8758_t:CDS:2 [Diversispora eburnea]|uniref:8758_t:CDS:1 n=1 Tax=Diversispora eburnea TaxID=1213867 RepID=A0A9N8WD64_9GLOM|nr:8758_t:CDS:2 [Diversispora eburnea]
MEILDNFVMILVIATENDYVVDGQHMIGKYFYEGSGTKKDIVKAIYWLNKAKENMNLRM